MVRRREAQGYAADGAIDLDGGIDETGSDGEVMYGRLEGAWTCCVEDDTTQAGYVGARAPTNNTGELTALRAALCTAMARPRGAGDEDIWADSLYAINMTTGRWRPKCKRNTIMVGDMRCIWRKLQRLRPHEVRLRHVRSHVKVPGNELADWLADLGRHFESVSRERAEEWLKAWLHRQQRWIDSERAGGAPTA